MIARAKARPSTTAVPVCWAQQGGLRHGSPARPQLCQASTPSRRTPLWSYLEVTISHRQLFPARPAEVQVSRLPWVWRCKQKLLRWELAGSAPALGLDAGRLHTGPDCTLARRGPELSSTRVVGVLNKPEP